MSHAAMNVGAKISFETLLSILLAVYPEWDCCVHLKKLIYPQWFCHGAVTMDVNMASYVQQARSPASMSGFSRPFPKVMIGYFADTLNHDAELLNSLS